MGAKQHSRGQVTFNGREEGVSDKKDEKENWSISTFCQRLQIHGLPDLHQARSYVARVFWTATMIIFCGLMVYFLGCNIRSYMQYPVKTEMKLEKPGKLGFPIITICPVEYVNDTKLAKEAWMRDYMKPQLTGDLMKGTKYVLPQGGEENDSAKLLYPVPTISPNAGYLLSVAYTIGELLSECEFKGMKVNCQDVANRYVDAVEKAVCIRVHFNDSQRFSGSGGRLQFNMFPKRQSISGLKLRIENAGDLFSRRYTMAEPGKYTKINLRESRTVYLDYPHGSDPQRCLSQAQAKEREKSFIILKAPYSQDTCMSDCMFESLIKHCECSAPIDIQHTRGENGSVKICNNTMWERCESNMYNDSELQQCVGRCDQMCEITEYTMSQSTMVIGLGDDAQGQAGEEKEETQTQLQTSPLNKAKQPASESTATPMAPPGDGKDLDLASSKVKRSSGTIEPDRKAFKPEAAAQKPEDVAILDISFEELHYTISTQKYAKSVTEMVSELGGQTGLWLGGSIITIIQLIILLCGCCFTGCR